MFQYASKHGYRKLMDDAALIAVQNKYLRSEIPSVCNRPELVSAWVRVYHPLHFELGTKCCLLMQYRYQDYWLDLFSYCYNEPSPVLHPGGTPDCKRWRKFRNVTISQVRPELTIFSKFGDIVEGTKDRLKDCYHCGIRADLWVRKVQQRSYIGERGERTTPFTTFLT